MNYQYACILRSSEKKKKKKLRKSIESLLTADHHHIENDPTGPNVYCIAIIFLLENLGIVETNVLRSNFVSRKVLHRVAFLAIITSGATYGALPHGVPKGRLLPACRNTVARPKSDIFSVPNDRM